MLRKSLVVFALLLLPVASARGAEADDPAPPALPAHSSYQEPDLISFGATYVDFDKSEPRTHSEDFRLEYRFGTPLLPAQNSWLDFGINPLAGVEFSTRSQLYGFGGLAFDFLFWKHLVLTESEAVGLFDSGDAKPLGSVIEFRSQLECGWRFDNDVRLTAVVGHISNAGLTHRNPGEEMAGGYLHVPVGMIFGN
jgi:hypothetical protein